MKLYGQWVALVFFVVLTILGLSELAFNYLGYGGVISPAGLYIPPDAKGYLFNPGEDSRDLNRTFKEIMAPVPYNSFKKVWLNGKSHSVIPNRRQTRVLFVGDSGTYGSYVKPEEVFSELLSHDPTLKHFDFLNSGLPGYSGGRVLTTLREKLIHLNPKKVVYLYFMGNDVLETLYEGRDCWSKPLKNWPSFWPLNQLSTYTYLKVLYANLEYKKLKSEDCPNALKQFSKDIEKSQVYAFTCQGRYLFHLKDPDPFTNMAWDIFENQLKQTKRLLEKNNITFEIVLFPTITEILGEYRYMKDEPLENCSLNGKPLNLSKINTYGPLKRMLSLCKSLGLQCYNPIPAIKDSVGTEFFNVKDDHASIEGHKFLHRFIKTEVLPKKEPRY